MIYEVKVERLKKNETIQLPASKSLSNRALILKALCEDDCELSNLSDCDDTAVMLKAFSEGVGEINIGAAGTSMRFLTAYYATRAGKEVILTGSERMKQRPIALLVNALRQLGADISYVENEGFPPLRICGKELEGGSLSIDGSTSSQYISALLMIAPTLRNGLQLELTGSITSRPYIDMTLGLMQYFGATGSWEGNVIKVAPQKYTAQSYQVESDWSASSYWFEMAALCRDLDMRLAGLHEKSLQGDSAVVKIYEQICSCEERFVLDMTETPDLAQTVICTLCALQKPFTISGLHTLRIKETDRVDALETELAKLGYEVKDRMENNTVVMTYEGGKSDGEAEAVIATYKDHRMAMAFAPLCMVLPSHSIRIDEPSVVSKSYPHYWDDLKKVGFEITEKE